MAVVTVEIVITAIVVVVGIFLLANQECDLGFAMLLTIFAPDLDLANDV